MTSKITSGLPERRVRSIWDAFETRQSKSALKLIAALQSKYPNSAYIPAIKALVLERAGKSDDALALCIEAKEKLTSDDSVLSDDHMLSTMQSVCQRLGRLDIATSCYEYACGKVSNSLDLMLGLFNCYVHESSFVKQQQMALKMYKFAGEERFLLWAVCSIQLQVLHGEDGSKLFPLAEGLLKKHVASHSLHEPDALQVYISILEQQAKYGPAQEILLKLGPTLLVIEVDRLRIEGRLLARACDYAAAAKVFMKVLEICPDDWECFLNYLGCLLEDDSRWCGRTTDDQIHPQRIVACKLSHLSEDEFDSRMSDASKFVQKLLAAGDPEFIRCPYLAKMEIERRKRLYGKKSDGLEEAIYDYFNRFGCLPCFTADVEIFLQFLNKTEGLQLNDNLLKLNSMINSEPRKQFDGLLTISRIQEWLGIMFTQPLIKLEIANLNRAKLYIENLSLSKNLDAQEPMRGEELLCMASNVLVQLYWRTRQLSYLLEAIMVLEFGLNIRRFFWQYKILLVHLYSHFNALPLAYEWYKTLDVKNILLETVSHHIVPQMILSPLWVDLTELLKNYLSFMDDHLAESADLTYLAYRHRNYTKVIEFVKFKERLEHSYQYLVAKLESSILQLKQKANNIEEVQSVLESSDYGFHFLVLSTEEKCKSLTFNDDTESRPWWTPTTDVNHLLGPFDENTVPGVREISWQQEQSSSSREENLRKSAARRSLVPRLIYLSMRCASLLKEPLTIADTPADSTILESQAIHAEITTLLGQYVQTLGYSFEDAVGKMTAVASGEIPVKNLGIGVIDFMNFGVFVNARRLCYHGLDAWQKVDNMIEKCTQEKLGCMQPTIIPPGTDLTILVQIVSEPLAWHSLVIQSCLQTSPQSSMASPQPQPSGKKKKKVSEQAIKLTTEMINTISSSIKSLIGTLERIIEVIKKKLEVKDDRKLEILLSSLWSPGVTKTEGPGMFIPILEAIPTSELVVGVHSKALRSWKAAEVGKKIISAQKKTLQEFLKICESKLKLMESLNKQIQQLSS